MAVLQFRDSWSLPIPAIVLQVYLCASTHDEDWTFGCAAGAGDASAPPPDLTEWYTVCGRPHSNKPLWAAYVAALAALGIATYRFCFSLRRTKGEKAE